MSNGSRSLTAEEVATRARIMAEAKRQTAPSSHGRAPQPIQPTQDKPKAPRPIGISTCSVDGWVFTTVLYDDGTIWERDEKTGGWHRLPPIPQGDA